MKDESMEYQVGERVVARDGIVDYFTEIPIGGWHGTVMEIIVDNGGPVLVIQWDDEWPRPYAQLPEQAPYSLDDIFTMMLLPHEVMHEKEPVYNESAKQDLPQTEATNSTTDDNLISIFRHSTPLDAVFRVLPRHVRQTGQNLYEWRRAVLQYVDDEYAEYRVQDYNGRIYKVSIDNTDGTPDGIEVSCTCPESEGLLGGDPCAHSVASVLALANLATQPGAFEKTVSQPTPLWEARLSRVLESVKPIKTRKPRHLLAFSLQERYGGNWRLIPYLLPVSLLPGELLDERAALEQAIMRLPHHYEIKEVTYYQQQPATPLYSNPELLSMAWQVGMANYYQSNNPLVFALPQLDGALLFRGDEVARTPFVAPIRILDRHPRQLLITSEPHNEGMRLGASIADGETMLALSAQNSAVILNDPLWVLVDNRLLRVEGDGALLRGLLDARDIIIPSTAKTAFVTRFLPKLLHSAQVDEELLGEQRDIHAEPRPRVYLREEGEAIVVDLAFAYDDYEVSLDTEWPISALQHEAVGDILIVIHRNPTVEETHWRALSKFGLKRDGARFVLKQRISPVDFLLRHLPQLQQAGYEVFGEEALKSARINRNAPKMSLSVSSGIDWFDVLAMVNYGEVSVSFSEVRKAIKQRQGFVKLPDGSLGALPDEWLKRYSQLFTMGEATEDGVRLSRTQATLLELALNEADSIAVDAEYTRRVEQLRNFTHIASRPLPEGFRGELRPYQRAGYDWLHFLHDFNFGGCLADDMGIGKTVQALIFLQSLYADGHTTAASLIVMPRSLLENWAREAARFTPNLRVLTHADSDRADDHSDFEHYHLVLTTYGVMLRDLKLFSKYRFHYLVLDESQAIKNPAAQTGRAARLLYGEHRLALTGTPIENSTEELWSLFAFLNPGQLGSQEAFREQFAAPIQRNQDENAAKTLRALVHPFILRRTKEQVAPELPPRTERLIYCAMTAKQKQLYQRTRDRYRDELLGLVDQGGMQQARFKVLEGLLRLRQLANDPRLIDKSFKGVSSKFEAILESMEVLREEGHKALVFSQFTSMLGLLRNELDTRDWPYLYLDGKTQHRQALVDEFQADENIPFFLISLRAGGTGLNLTAADYVIHIDPWWNPAVERQATDRTHRIGQHRPVMIYKFIAEDTVEQKILLLQEKKQALVEQLISTEGSFMKTLSRDDITALFT